MSEAHNGSRDELGGHFRNSDCMYLLHEPTSLVKSANNIHEFIDLIYQYNGNEKCKSTLNESKVDLDGYLFPSENQKESNSSDNENRATPAVQLLGTDLILGEKYLATLEKCTDGDTAQFNINGTIYKTRFLYIDTPESTNKIEPFGKEASEFTCSFLKQGSITLETDGKDLFDKYDRLLAWVWVDNKLHQEEITKAGLVKKFYDYGDYKYENRINAAMDYAKENGIGLFEVSNEKLLENKQGKEEIIDPLGGISIWIILFIIVLTIFFFRNHKK